MYSIIEPKSGGLDRIRSGGFICGTVKLSEMMIVSFEVKGV